MIDRKEYTKISQYNMVGSTTRRNKGVNSSAKWVEEYGEEVPKKSNKRGKAAEKSNKSTESDQGELTAAITTLLQVVNANELKSFAERNKKEDHFWGQPRLITRSI